MGGLTYNSLTQKDLLLMTAAPKNQVMDKLQKTRITFQHSDLEF
jgi:hypothetical protein